MLGCQVPEVKNLADLGAYLAVEDGARLAFAEPTPGTTVITFGAPRVVKADDAGLAALQRRLLQWVNASGRSVSQ